MIKDYFCWHKIIIYNKLLDFKFNIMDFGKALLACLLLYCGTNANAESYPVVSLNKTDGIAQMKGIRISGTVTDKDKNPLPGVNVLLQGGEGFSGVITDVDGHFYLDVPSKETVIEVSYVGFKTQKIKVGSKINFDIILEEDVEALEEVVVTGYGSQKKMSVIGSIETLQPKKLQVGTSRSLSNNLAGQIAGVIAVQRSGEPGYDSSNFWIRGIASFSGNQNPLVLVDGIERDLNNIDPAEIESFSVLKDASASAMYGVRGANGVIVINTKRGKIGAPSINFRVEQSIAEPTKLPEFIGAADHMALLNEITADKTRLPFTQEQIDRTRNGYDPDLYPDVNWLDAITKDYAFSTRANLTVSGGSDFLRYSLVGSYFGERGIMATDDTLPYDTGTKLTRYNMRANVDLDVTKTTVLRLNVGGFLQTHRKHAYSTDDSFNRAFMTSPFVHPIRYSDGAIPITNANGVNPWAAVTQSGYDVVTASQIQSLFAVEQNLKMITPGLKAKVTFSFDRWNQSSITRKKNSTLYAPATGRDPEGNLIHTVLKYGDEALGHGNKGEYGNSRVYFEGTLMYNRTFGKHDVDALFLYNQQSYDDGGIQPYRKQGIAGRLSYTFDSRYVTEFNFGYNGSENFDKGKRFGFFPSFALGWLVSEEPFMDRFRNTLSKLKLRASIGKVGNDNIGGRRFAYITTLNTDAGSYNWGDTGQIGRTGISEGEVGVGNLTWETALKMNLGVELGLWNELDMQVDIFREKRTDIFMQRKVIPSQAGFLTNPWANFGEVTNRGVEVSLNYNKQINDDWFVGFRSNFTYAINKVDEYDEPESVIGTYRGLTGRSLNTLWGLQAERLFEASDFDENGNLKFGIPTQEVGSSNVRPGDIKYVDMNGDGVITDADEGYIGGTVDPRIVYGFGGNVNYKNWDLNFFFQGTGDTYRVIGNTEYFIPGSGQTLQGNVYSNYNDRWTEDNPSQDVFWPRLTDGPYKQNYRASTWWKKNMRFLRLKTLELGYSLPKKITDKIHAKSIRFYLSGNNLFCFSPFDLWDPELDTDTGLRYPAMRSVMLGVDLNF